MSLRPPLSTLFPYTTLFRSAALLHSDHRRIRHSRSAWRLALADDRPDAVDRVLLQPRLAGRLGDRGRSEEHTSELQSQFHLVCRLLLEKKNTTCVTRTSLSV